MIAAAEDVEQTVVLPAVGNQQAHDGGSQIAAGRFQQFAVRPPVPDVTQPAWPYFAVCWPRRAGHWFAWKYLPHGVVPRCSRSGCDRDEADVRDPLTGDYLPCIGQEAARN